MKRILLLMLCIGLMLLLAGCSREELMQLYDSAVRTIDQLELAGEDALDGGHLLSGDRLASGCTARYEDFTGEERILGSAFVGEGEEGRMTVSCVMTAESGAGWLGWQCGTAEPVILMNAPGTLIQDVELTEAANAFVIHLEHFTGTVKIKIENADGK